MLYDTHADRRIAHHHSLLLAESMAFENVAQGVPSPLPKESWPGKVWRENARLGSLAYFWRVRGLNQLPQVDN